MFVNLGKLLEVGIRISDYNRWYGNGWPGDRADNSGSGHIRLR